MNTIKRYLLSVLFLCVSLSAFSQASVYPIQLSAAMLPPYTNCMGDYFSNGRVQLKVIVRDMSRYDASLEYSISVKIKQGGRVVLASKGPLKRRFSQAQIVNDISLKDLFSDRSNYTVTGGASNFFDNGYCLEEGSYEFEYQLFDKNNGKMPLSEPFSVYCYLTQAEPPVGVFPEDGKCYEESELPQTILFQWIDPIAIGPQNRSYELHIKENGTDMNFTGNMFSAKDAPSSMEFYNQNVYNNNFVLINNSSGKFNVGNTYYWYVQTKSVADGIHGQNAYKNNGKSQTYSFSIGNCHQEEPKIDFDDSKAKNKAKTKVRIELDEVKVEGDVVTPKWELKSNKDNELICGFKIYCYKAGGNPDDASEVKNMTSICNQFKEGDIWTDNLNSSVLEKGVEYFCFVRPVVKDGAIGLKSNEISFKLASPNASSSSKNEDDGCGVDLEHRPCEELLTTVPKYFFANDGHQVILVDQTTKLEGDAFTGAGIITPAWLKNMVPDVMPLTGLNVEFEKIKINSDGYLCEGEIKVVSDPATNLYFDLNELVDFKAGSDAAAKQREVYTKEVDKKEDIKGDDFNGQIVHEKSTGDLYAVPMGGGTPEKVAKCLNKREYCPLQYRGALNDAGIYLRFDVDATLNDGYSPYIDKEAKPFTAENILNGYVSSGSDYIQPWISMVQGETKYIKAYFEGGSVDPDDVEFYLISQNSIALLEKSYENGYFKVRIYGGQPTRSLQIVARSKAKKKDCSDGNNSDSKDGNATNTDTNAGTNGNSASSDNDSNKNSNDCEECEAVTYGSAQIYMLSSKKIKVMLVPVVQNATNNNLNIDDLKAKVSAANDIINQRFAPLGRQFELVVDAAFEYKDIDPTTGFNVSEDNSEWTKETEEMKALRKAYGLKVGKRNEYQACLFLLTQAQKEGLQGYMPRSNSVGFIFLGDNFANVQSDIMAHELCHGLFGLQHTFAYAGVAEGAVKENLMDYVAHNDERYLSKYFQWNNMERFNGHVFKLLDDVEDGEFKAWDHWEDGGIILTSIPTKCQDLELNGFEKGKLVPFLDPVSNIVLLPSSAKYLTFNNVGRLISFCIPLADGNLEKWNAEGSKEDNFKGYFCVDKLNYNDAYPSYQNNQSKVSYYYKVRKEGNCDIFIDKYSYLGALSEQENKNKIGDEPVEKILYSDDYNINCLSEYYRKLYVFLSSKYNLDKNLDEKTKGYLNNLNTKSNKTNSPSTFAQLLYQLMKNAADHNLVISNNKDYDETLKHSFLNYFNSKENLNDINKVKNLNDIITPESLYNDWMENKKMDSERKKLIGEFTNVYYQENIEFSLWDQDICTAISYWLSHFDSKKTFFIISHELDDLFKNPDSKRTNKCSSENWAQELAKIEKVYNNPNCGIGELSDAIKDCCVEALKNFPIDCQTKYITKLIEGGTWEARERSVLKIISCISDAEGFYKYLSKNNSQNLFNLIDEIDNFDPFPGHSRNYSYLMKLMCHILEPYYLKNKDMDYWSRHIVGEKRFQVIPDYILVKNDPNILLPSEDNLSKGSWLEEDYSFSINERKVSLYNSYSKFVYDRYTSSYSKVSTETVLKNANPLEPVIYVVPNSILATKAIDLYDIILDKDDGTQAIIVPAIFFKYIKDLKSEQILTEIAEIGIDVISLGVGVVGFVNDVRKIEKINKLRKFKYLGNDIVPDWSKLKYLKEENVFVNKETKDVYKIYYSKTKNGQKAWHITGKEPVKEVVTDYDKVKDAIDNGSSALFAAGDIVVNHWYVPYVAENKENGFVQGYNYFQNIINGLNTLNNFASISKKQEIADVWNAVSSVYSDYMIWYSINHNPNNPELEKQKIELLNALKIFEK